MLYLSIITISVLLSIILNFFLNPMHLNFFIYLIIHLAFVLGEIALCGIDALLVRLLPNKWFVNYNKPFFFPSKRRMNFFKKIKISKWKEKVPEWGAVNGFRKNRISNPNDPQYLKRFLLEICYGVGVHKTNLIAGLLQIPLYAIFDKLIFGENSNIIYTCCLPVSIIGSILFYIPTFVLQSYLPKMARLYEFKSLKALTTKEENNA